MENERPDPPGEGSRAERPITGGPWGAYAFFKDPEENLLRVGQNILPR